MGKKPRRLISDAEHTVKLMCAHAFFGSPQEMHGKKPLVKRDFRILHNRSNGDGELFAAGIALVKARAMRLPLQCRDIARIAVAAMRANRTVRPALRLQIFAGFFGVLEAWISEVHG